MSDPFDVVVSALGRAGCDPRVKGPGSAESRCPAHQGMRYNLSIDEGDDGRVLLSCHHCDSTGAGCSNAAIVEAVGLELRDLFPADPSRNRRAKPSGKAKSKRTHKTFNDAVNAIIWSLNKQDGNTSGSTWEFEERWPYHRLDGTTVFAAVRFKNGSTAKSYRPVHGVDGGFMIGDPPGLLPLYHLPELAGADRVFVCEGEKCVDALRRLGLSATTSAHGARSAYKSDWGPLAGREVVILPDRDAPGEGYAASVIGLLAKLDPPPSVKVVRLPELWQTDAPIEEGDDIVDWLREGVPETDCRAALEKAADEAPGEILPDPDASKPIETGAASAPKFANFALEKFKENGEDKVRIVPFLMREIEANLHRVSPGWPKSVGGVLFVERADGRPEFLDKPNRLMAWIDGTRPVDWKEGAQFVTQARFYEHLRMNAQDFDTIERMPHFPPMPRAYYMHQSLPEPTGTRLAELLDFFTGSTSLDRSLILAFILTLFWGGPPGRRPAFLATGPERDPEQGRGVGKTTFFDVICGELGGGSSDISPSDKIAAIKTRLLSDQGGEKRAVRIDNVKSEHFSWGDLESLITDANISGHRLYNGDASRPNTLVFTITINGAALSKDLAQRCVVITLARPQHRATWEEEVRGFIRRHRWQLIADVGAILGREPGNLQPRTRWSTWESDVLSKVDGAAECQDLIVQRQGVADSDSENKLIVSDHFRAELERCGYTPDRDCVLIPTAVLAAWLGRALNERFATNKVSPRLTTLGIPELARSNRGDVRAWVWRGVDCPPTAPAARLYDPDRDERRIGPPPQPKIEVTVNQRETAPF